MKRFALFSFLTLLAISSNCVAQDLWEQYVFPFGSWAKSILVTQKGSILIAVDGIGMYRSSDEGVHWILGENTPSWVYSIAESSSGTLYTGTYSIDNYKSIDDGISWQATGTLPGSKRSICVADSGVLFMTFGNLGIFKSSDEGNTWNYTNIKLHDAPLLYYSKRRKTIFAATTDSLFRSTNGGDSWEQLPYPKPIIRAFTSMENGYIFAATSDADSRGGVYRSRNNGDSWERLGMTPDMYPYSANAVVVNSLGHIYASGGDPFWRSLDSGKTGEDFSYGLLGPIFCLAIDQKGRVYGGSVGVVWRTIKSTTEIERVDGAMPLSISLGQAYPNPARENVTLLFGLPTSTHIALTLHDALGRNVLTVVDEVRPPGNYTASFNVRGLPAGFYYCRLEAGGRVVTRPLSVLN